MEIDFEAHILLERGVAEMLVHEERATEQALEVGETCDSKMASVVFTSIAWIQ